MDTLIFIAFCIALPLAYVGIVEIVDRVWGMCARLSELDPGYCDVIVERWENYTGRKAVLEVSHEEN